MLRRLLLTGAAGVVFAAAFVLALGAGSWQAVEAITNCSTGSEGLDGDETSVATQINQQRANSGLPPLLVSPNLNRASAWKSADSSNTGAGFSHTDSLGRGPGQRALDCGYPTMAGENIAYGYSAAGVVNAWMTSPGHQANILSSFAKVMGIGHTGSSWVWMYGSVVDSGAFSVGSSTQPTSTPVPANTNPGGGSGPPPGASPSSFATSAAAPATGSGSNANVPIPGVRTVLPGGDKPQYSLPANVPVKRATILMISSE